MNALEMGGGGGGQSVGATTPKSMMMNSNLSSSATPKITKFSGVTGDVVSDSTSSGRCCIIM